MNCDRSKALVSVYVDGELSEELAGPLRRHLMECSECRASLSEAKALGSWFVPSAELRVPEGFAARVARLAVSGAGTLAPSATGGSGVEVHDWLVPSRATHDPRRGARGTPPSVDRTTRFAMSLATLAAAVLIGLTLLLASGDGPGFDGSAIQAQPPVETVLQALEDLNRREAAAAAAVSAPMPSPVAPAAVTPADGAAGSVTEQPKSQR